MTPKNENPYPALRKPVKRYILFQLPGFFMMAALLTGLHLFLGLDGRWIVPVLLLWVAKDALMFRFTWRAYLLPEYDDTSRLLGGTAIAVQDFDSEGMVRIRGELWQARLAAGQEDMVKKGDKLLVTAIKGMQLLVSKKD